MKEPWIPSPTRPGRRKSAVPRVHASVRIPEPVFDALCHHAMTNGDSLHKFMVRVLTRAVAPKPPISVVKQ